MNEVLYTGCPGVEWVGGVTLDPVQIVTPLKYSGNISMLDRNGRSTAGDELVLYNSGD